MQCLPYVLHNTLHAHLCHLCCCSCCDRGTEKPRSKAMSSTKHNTRNSIYGDGTSLYIYIFYIYIYLIKCRKWINSWVLTESLNITSGLYILWWRPNQSAALETPTLISITSSGTFTWECWQSSQWTVPPPHHTVCHSSSSCHTGPCAHHRDIHC